MTRVLGHTRYGGDDGVTRTRTRPSCRWRVGASAITRENTRDTQARTIHTHTPVAGTTLAVRRTYGVRNAMAATTTAAAAMTTPTAQRKRFEKVTYAAATTLLLVRVRVERMRATVSEHSKRLKRHGNGRTGATCCCREPSCCALRFCVCTCAPRCD